MTTNNNNNGNNKIKLLYLAIATLSCKMLYNCNLFVSLITIDGLLSACSWMLSYFNKNIKFANVTENAKIYNNSTVDRYISYMTIYLGYSLITTFFWTKDISVLYYLLSLLPIPDIINSFVSSPIYDKINSIKQMLIKKIIAKNIVLGIKTACKVYINKEVNIKYKEIMPLLSNYDKSVTIASNMTKNLLLVLLMSYIRKYTSRFYYDISKRIVSYKFGNTLDSFNVNGARSKLINIIDGKEWDKILEPKFIKLVLSIYEEHENNSDDIKKIIATYGMSFSGMLVLWTICSFLKYSCIAPIISIIMVLYRRDYGVEMYSKLVTLCLILGSSIFTNNYLLISVLSQFGYYLVFNRVTFVICKNILKNIYKWANKIIQKDSQYNKVLAITVPYSLVLYKTVSSGLLTRVLPVTIFYNLMVNNDGKFNALYGVTMITTMLSQTWIHIVYNAILMYVMIKLIDRNIFSDLHGITNRFVNEVFVKIKGMMVKKKISKGDCQVATTTVPQITIDTAPVIDTQTVDLSIFEKELAHDDFMDAITVKDVKEPIDGPKIDNTIYIIDNYDTN